jgi:NADPH-dependent 2,4-dienoyl-CoA reductase/sulfur reductase-like enzyme
MPDIVIVGAGPAGIAAANVLVAQGIAPILLDEGRRPGGQAYRMPPPELDLDIDALLGSERGKYRRIHATFDGLRDRIDYRPETLAWDVFDGEVYSLTGSVVERHRYDALILATGAVDRVLPIKGWTLPGVFTLGGAQVLLKGEGCLIGRRVVFCGSSPLLYLAALQYRMMGAEIAAVLDTTPFRSKVGATARLMSSPRTFARGVSYLAKLKRDGVAVEHGVRLLEIKGSEGVDGVVSRSSGGDIRELGCDAVAFDFGLRSETQLAELAGCELRYDATFRQWVPTCDAEGRCGNGVYVAGDGSAIGGADAAELSGTLAAHAVLDDRGLSRTGADRTELRRRLQRLRRFQTGLASAFVWPIDWLRDLADEVPVCRCENVTAGELRQTIRAEFGADEVNRLKALTRCGMGRCQGRFCGLAATELIAGALGRPHESAGRLRVQAPVKPLPIAAGAAE